MFSKTEPCQQVNDCNCDICVSLKLHLQAYHVRKQHSNIGNNKVGNTTLRTTIFIREFEV